MFRLDKETEKMEAANCLYSVVFRFFKINLTISIGCLVSDRVMAEAIIGQQLTLVMSSLGYLKL